ncbi:hypothetical protein Tco_0122383 [Tanacetum coccineum]
MMRDLIRLRSSFNVSNRFLHFSKNGIGSGLRHKTGMGRVIMCVKNGGDVVNGGDSCLKEDDGFGLDVLRFHTCLTDILGFIEKLGWWFEQDIDVEEGRFEGNEDGCEV